MLPSGTPTISSFELGDRGRIYSSTGESSTATLEQIQDELLKRRGLNKKGSRTY